MTFPCHHCGQFSLQNKICQRCRSVFYCSKSCQKSDWKWRSRPKVLMALTRRSGNDFWRSLANCSASHSETSHPVNRISIDCGWSAPLTWASNLLRKHLDRLNAVKRFKLLPAWFECHSSWIDLHIFGISKMNGIQIKREVVWMPFILDRPAYIWYIM